MELITTHIVKIEEFLSRMDDMLLSARSVPFSSKVSVDRDAVYLLIDDMRHAITEMKKSLPAELNQAKRVLSDKESHIVEGRVMADNLIKSAKIEAAKLRDEHAIVQEAREAAKEIQDSAYDEVNSFRLSAAEAVDNVFRELEDLLKSSLESQKQRADEIEEHYNNTLDELYEYRRSIRVNE